MIQESALPASLMDLAKPEWAGKLGIAPSDADFLPLVSAVIAAIRQASRPGLAKGAEDKFEDLSG